jgi:hypothetical protein
VNSIVPAISKEEVRSSYPDIHARAFPYLLLAITVAALVPRLILGTSQFVHYDGYWHVFTATQDRWELFISEWQRDAHPPLYYLLLRVVASLGHSHLLYRSLSIIPGVASVYVIGRIARNLCRNTTVALLTAAGYGFSITVIDITCDVRGYALALFLVLLAFYYFLDFLLGRCQQKQVKRSIALFGIFTSLGIAVEYYAVFFWIACLGVMLLNALWDPEFRKTKVGWLVREWFYVVPFIFGMPLCVLLYLYEAHLQLHLRPEKHVIQFYWDPSRSLTQFILQSLCDDLNYILPIAIPSTIALLMSLLPIVALIWFFAFGQEREVTRAASTAPILVLVLLLLELIVLGVTGHYPFGGEARHQSIIFPFVLLSCFQTLDRCITLLRLPLIKNVVLVSTAALVIVSFSYGWRRFPKVSQELFTPEYNVFTSGLHQAQAVYVDQFSLIAYYIHTHAWRWQFQKHLLEPRRVDSYRISTSSGEHLILLRNKKWNFDLRSPVFYTDLATALRSARVSSANLFYLANVDRAALTVTRETICLLADQAGLTAEPVLRGDDGLFIGFRLK